MAEILHDLAHYSGPSSYLIVAAAAVGVASPLPSHDIVANRIFVERQAVDASATRSVNHQWDSYSSSQAHNATVAEPVDYLADSSDSI